jgi:hypothetical protein
VVDGSHGRDLLGLVSQNAHANSNGEVVILCAPNYACTPDSEQQLAVRPGDCFRIVVLNVRGLAVVLAASRAPGLWDAANTKFTDPAGRPSIPGILNGPSTGVL